MHTKIRKLYKTSVIRCVAILALLLVCTPFYIFAQTTTPTPLPTPDMEVTIVDIPVEGTPIIKHFIFDDGKEIPAYPTPTPFIDTQKIIEQMKKEVSESLKQNPPPSAEDLEKEILNQMTEPNISKCFDNITNALEVPGESFPEGLEGSNSPYHDMLFMEANEVPQDAELIFGATILVVPFIRERPNMSWEYITEFEVPCLPYRIRLQGSKMYLDQGLNALKDYSKNPIGVFHPYIKQRYGAK